MGSATHAGGSCQTSLSFDGGNTWTLIKSWIGGCVNPDPGSNQTFEFGLPSDVRGGEALFAWYLPKLFHCSCLFRVRRLASLS